MYDALRTSLAKGSVAPLEAAYAPDAIVVNEAGAEERHVAPKSTEFQWVGGRQPAGSEVRVIRLEVGSDAATTIVSIRFGVSVLTAAGKRFKVETVTAAVHDWRRTAAGWRIVRETMVNSTPKVEPKGFEAAVVANVKATEAANKRLRNDPWSRTPETYQPVWPGDPTTKPSNLRGALEGP